MDIYFSKMTPEFIAEARAVAAAHEEQLTAAKMAAAMDAQAAAIANGMGQAEAAAAGRAAAAAVVRLPDDPLDKVQQYEQRHAACPHGGVAPEPSADAPKRKMGKKARAVAAAASAAMAAAEGPGEPDRVPRTPPPSCEVLRELLRIKGLKTGGKKAELSKRLEDAEAREDLDDDRGAADSSVADADEEAEQPRRRRRGRRVHPVLEFDADTDEVGEQRALPLAGSKRLRAPAAGGVAAATSFAEDDEDNGDSDESSDADGTSVNGAAERDDDGDDALLRDVREAAAQQHLAATHELEGLRWGGRGGAVALPCSIRGSRQDARQPLSPERRAP